jgi:CubicO group peptidase (beta-lactamase class C family)
VFDRDTPHNLASVTKSFTSALVGIAVDRGALASLNERVFTYFPEHADLSGGGKNEIALEHLITMTSGLEWDETTYWYPDPRNDIVQLFLTDEPIRYVLAKPLVAEPGTQFNYSGGCTNVLGEAVRKASLLPLDTLAEQFLFTPLGVTDHEWQYLPGGAVFASGDLRLRPRDMAKFGFTYLTRGIWNGARVLSQDWITASTSRHISLDWGWTDGYGYGWWTKTYEIDGRLVETFFASGWGGQQISVVPEMNMVVVFTGGGYYEDPLLSPEEMMREYALPAAL